MTSFQQFKTRLSLAFRANFPKPSLMSSYLGRVLIKLASIWQVGGVLFPPCILSSYRIPSSHTTPFMVEECAKGTSRLCRRGSRWWKVSFISLRAPKSPETSDSTKSLIHLLAEAIQAWRYWYANMVVQLQVCWSGLQNSHGSTPDTFLFCSHNDPPVNGPCERLAPVRVHIGSKHAWIRPIPDIGMDGWMWLLQIYTPIWKWLLTLSVEVKCPHAGEEWLLRDGLPVCQPADGALHAFSQAWNSWRMGRFEGTTTTLNAAIQLLTLPHQSQWDIAKLVWFPHHISYTVNLLTASQKTRPLTLQVTWATGHLVTTPLPDFLLAAEVRVSPLACPGVRVQSAFHLQGHLCSFDPRCSGLFSDWWGDSDYVLMHPL